MNHISVRNLYSGYTGAEVAYGPTAYTFNPKEEYGTPNDFEDHRRQAVADLLMDANLQHRVWKLQRKPLQGTSLPEWLKEPHHTWRTHLYAADDQVLWSLFLLMREQVAAFPALETIVSNSESAGPYTALVFERLMAAH